MRQLPTLLGPAVHRGKDTTHENLKTMRVCGPNNVGRAAGVNRFNIVALHFGNHRTKEMLLAQKFDRFQTVRNNSQQHATINMQKGAQMDMKCNIQLYWEWLANKQC